MTEVMYYVEWVLYNDEVRRSKGVMVKEDAETFAHMLREHPNILEAEVKEATS